MKKQLFSLILVLLPFLWVHAQKESGIVYSEHEAISKTKACWAAFVKGDKETFLSFFADTVNVGFNGNFNKRPKKFYDAVIDWWQGFDNLSCKDDTPAFPDAIKYKEGGLWVQDWIRVTGTHRETGINIDIPMHNLYRLNKDGKFDIIIYYYDDNMLDEITNSTRTIENGTVFINHPYIVTVRKLVNAYCAENMEALKSYYSQKAVFWKSDFKAMKFISLEEKMKEDKETFEQYDNIQLKQVGYPDCIYYIKDDAFIVYSWWNLSFTTKDGKKKSDIPVMLSHDFDKDGKISREFIYLSSNHFE